MSAAQTGAVVLRTLLNRVSASFSPLLFLSLASSPMPSLPANWSAGCPLLIKSFNRQSIKSYFPPPRAHIHIVIQFVTMETAGGEKLCDHLMEPKWSQSII